MVAFSQVKPNTIKLRAIPLFPSRVEVGAGLSFDRTNGVYSFAVDFSDLEREDVVTSDELAQLYVAAWDSTDKTFRLYLGSELKGDKGDTGDTGSSTAYMVYVDDYGAIQNDNTKGAVNATAFAAAMASGKRVHIKDGSTYYINAIVTPSNAIGIYGRGTLIGLTVGANSAVVEINGVTNGFELDGMKVTAPAGLAVAIYVFTSNHVRIENVSVSTPTLGTGIAVYGSDDVIVANSNVSAYGTYGIITNTVTNCKVIGNTVLGGIDTFNNAISNIGTSANVVFSDNAVTGAGTFGLAMNGVSNGTISGNISNGSKREGIIVADGHRVVVCGNSLYFDSATTIDAGITIDANIGGVSDVLVIGNSVFNPGANGIQVIDDGTGVELIRVTIVGNIITNPNANNNTGIAAYVGNGIALIGNANNSVVHGNTIIDTSGHMQYAVAEYTLGGDSPSSNIIGSNFGTAGALGRYRVIGFRSTTSISGFVGNASYTVATVPSAAECTAGASIFVSNESGGSVLAFSDGTNWRRVTDRAIIS